MRVVRRVVATTIEGTSRHPNEDALRLPLTNFWTFKNALRAWRTWCRLMSGSGTYVAARSSLVFRVHFGRKTERAPQHIAPQRTGFSGTSGAGSLRDPKRCCRA